MKSFIIQILRHSEIIQILTIWFCQILVQMFDQNLCDRAGWRAGISGVWQGGGERAEVEQL